MLYLNIFKKSKIKNQHGMDAVSTLYTNSCIYFPYPIISSTFLKKFLLLPDKTATVVTDLYHEAAFVFIFMTEWDFVDEM